MLSLQREMPIFLLALTLHVDIQAGHVIGACTYDPPEVDGCTAQLDVIGRNAGPDHFSVYLYIYIYKIMPT